MRPTAVSLNGSTVQEFVVVPAARGQHRVRRMAHRIRHRPRGGAHRPGGDCSRRSHLRPGRPSAPSGTSARRLSRQLARRSGGHLTGSRRGVPDAHAPPDQRHPHHVRSAAVRAGGHAGPARAVAADRCRGPPALRCDAALRRSRQRRPAGGIPPAARGSRAGGGTPSGFPSCTCRGTTTIEPRCAPS